MTEFEKELILKIVGLLKEIDQMRSSRDYWQQEHKRLNNLYEKLTNDYVTLSKSVVNG